MNTNSFSRTLALCLAVLGILIHGAADASAQKILVYDGSNHKSAELAAQLYSPGNVTIATNISLPSLISSQTWDAVLVNSPGTKPTDWTQLATYITQGGRAAVSHWDYDLTTYAGMAALLAACEVSVNTTITLNGSTIVDSGTSAIFGGLPMPNSDWHGHWGDDGDTFNLFGSAQGLAHLGNPAAPTMIRSNGGNTILMPLFDELGDTWLNFGHDITLWTNVINEILAGGTGSCTERKGILGLNPTGYDCNFPPRAGFNWNSTVETFPSAGTSTLATIIAVSLSGTTEGSTIFGYELLTLAPYVLDISFGTHSISVPPGTEGFFFASQGVRIEVDPLSNIYTVLLNAQDLVIG